MPEHHRPDLYVDEAGVGAHSIEGVATSTAGLVGFAQRGPLNTPVVVASTSEFIAAFGSIDVSQPLSLAVESFFLNGGKRAVIVRAGADDRPGQRSGLPGDIIGRAEKNTGLHALRLCKERLGLLLTPDAAFMTVDEAAQVSTAAVEFAEVVGIFHICDVPDSVVGLGPDAVVSWAESAAPRSRNVAIYFPWLNAVDDTRKSGNTSRRPPAAIAAAIYARTDEGHGVWKSPAGTDAAVIGAAGVTTQLNDAMLAKFASVSINPIREIARGDIVLWGARTRADGDPEWRYVSVRRLGLFLEHSIRDGIEWAMFGPSGESVWSQIRLAASSFLHTAWRAGAFPAARPEDAYFIRCDATTMTADDIANGRIIVRVGFAPLKPAEFVVLKIALSRS